MNRHLYVLGVAVATLAFAGLGADCGEPIIGDLDGGVEDGGGEPGCRETNTCIPDKYADTDQGAADTTDYYQIGVMQGGSFVASNQSGTVPAIDGFAEGQAIEYWLVSPVNDQAQLIDLFPQGATIVNKIYVFPSGQGRSVINVGADSANYSPLLQVWRVDVPDNYTADTLKSEQAILDSAQDADTGITLTATNDVLVVAVVDPDIQLGGTGGPALEEFWNGGFLISGYNFEGGNPDGTIPITDDTTDPAQIAPEPFLSSLHQFRRAGAGLCFGRNVYSALYGEPAYTPVPTLNYWIADYTACDQIPTSETEVLDEVDAGNIEVNTAQDPILIVAPQVPR